MGLRGNCSTFFDISLSPAFVLKRIQSKLEVLEAKNAIFHCVDFWQAQAEAYFDYKAIAILQMTIFENLTEVP